MDTYLDLHVAKRLEGKVPGKSVTECRGLMRRSSADERMDAGAIQVGDEYQAPIGIRLRNLTTNQARPAGGDFGIGSLMTWRTLNLRQLMCCISPVMQKTPAVISVPEIRGKILPPSRVSSPSSALSKDALVLWHGLSHNDIANVRSYQRCSCMKMWVMKALRACVILDRAHLM